MSALTASLVPIKRSRYERINWLKSIPFLALQFSPLAYIFTGIGWSDPVIIGVRCFIGMFLVTGVRHRFFSHPTYHMRRWIGFCAGFLAEMDLQKGILWWASSHRGHHAKADREEDPHTPRKGFWWSHMGWIMSNAHRRLHKRMIPDLIAKPELEWLERLNLIPPVLLASLFYWLHGARGLVDFLNSTLLLMHATFLINSFAHLPSVGKRRFEMENTSRNSWILAVITGGEGWHNNHHHNPGVTQQGIGPGEIDTTFSILKLLERWHVVSDVKAHDWPNSKAA